MNAQRTEDYKNSSYALAGGVVDPLPDDAPQFVKDYYAYYKTPRGYHPRSLNSSNGWNVTSSLPFMNLPILQYASEIRSAVLLVHGEKAHSRYFSESVYKKLTGDNKELRIIPGASHTDLYDRMSLIPFEKLNGVFSGKSQVKEGVSHEKTIYDLPHDDVDRRKDRLRHDGKNCRVQ